MPLPKSPDPLVGFGRGRVLGSGGLGFQESWGLGFMARSSFGGFVLKLPEAIEDRKPVRAPILVSIIKCLNLFSPDFS